MSYLSVGSDAQRTQLKVQELVVKSIDNIVTTSGVTATIDVQQTISEVRAALFIDDSAATSAPVVAANRSVSGSTVTLTLSAALASADAIVLYFVV